MTRLFIEQPLALPGSANNVNEQSLQQQATSEARLTLENGRECPFEIDLCVQGQSIHITGWRTKRIQPQLVTTTAVLTTKKRFRNNYRIKTGRSTQMKETPRGRETKMREFSEEGTPRGRNSFSMGKPGPYTKVLPVTFVNLGLS